MAFIYAMLIGGAICAITQLMTEIKIPFPIVAILLITVGGGFLTKIGVIDFLNELGAGGASVTALGCGNGAYGAGVALMNTGQAVPLILVALLNVVLVAMGAACGNGLLKRFSGEVPGPDQE